MVALVKALFGFEKRGHCACERCAASSPVCSRPSLSLRLQDPDPLKRTFFLAMPARAMPIMRRKVLQRMTVVKSCSHFVFCALKKQKGPSTAAKSACRAKR